MAHAEGIVHRDLKPGNVFLSRAAADEVFVKVVDFGISKVLKSSATKLTMTRAVFGTPEYMAPEQAAGLVESIDHRSDQWSLACVGWQMLSGQLPFWKPDVQSLLNQVVAGEPNALAPDQAGRIPPEVDKVLRRALSKRREDRFPTINAFARAFEAAAVEAPATTAPAPARPTPAARGAERETPRPSRLRLGPWLVLGAVWLALAAAGWMFRSELSAAVSKRFPGLWPGGSPSAHRPHSAGGPTVVPLPPDDDGEHRRRHLPARH